MFEFFDTIIGYVDVLWTFFMNFIESMGTALGVLSSATVVSQYISPLLPGIIGGSVVITLGIYVSKFVIGR